MTDYCDNSASGRLTLRIIDEAVAFTVAAFGWENGEHVRHVWWTEQQTNHTRCAYCNKHPWELAAPSSSKKSEGMPGVGETS